MAPHHIRWAVTAASDGRLLRNARGVRTATSLGMEWVGESEKCYDLRLQVYRLRTSELDVPRVPGG